MKGYPVFRVDGLVFRGFVAVESVFVPKGPHETIEEAIEFHMLTQYPRLFNNNINTSMNWDQLTRVGISE